jgi:hypothetical protein
MIHGTQMVESEQISAFINQDRFVRRWIRPLWIFMYIPSLLPSLRPDSFIGWDSFPKSICFPLPLPLSLARFISPHHIANLPRQTFSTFSQCQAHHLFHPTFKSYTHVLQSKFQFSQTPHLQLYRRALHRYSWNLSQEESLEMRYLFQKEARSSFPIDSHAAIFCRIGQPLWTFS